MQQNPNRKFIVIIVGAGLLIFTFILLMFFSLRNSNTLSVQIEVIPGKDSKLTIDGNQTDPGKVHLSKGEHTLQATRQYFGGTTKKINTDDLKEDQIIFLILDANTPEAIKFMLVNTEEQMRYEQAIGSDITAKHDVLFGKYPILSQLPYSTTEFTVDYSVDKKSNVTFQVTVDPVAAAPGTALYDQKVERYKNKALDFMKSQGVDVDKANITFDVQADTN